MIGWGIALALILSTFFCTHRDGFLDKKSSKPFVGGIDIFREEKCLYCTYVVSACFGVSEYSVCNA